MSQALPRTRETNVIGQQILRSATSVAANYRAAGRARSKAEFVSKIGVVIEEADETVFWLEILNREAGKTRKHAQRSQSTTGNLCRFAPDRKRVNSGRVRRDGDVGDDVR